MVVAVGQIIPNLIEVEIKHPLSLKSTGAKVYNGSSAAFFMISSIFELILSIFLYFRRGEDHVMVRLAVRVNSIDFVQTNFTFFDCEAHTSCTACVESRFRCLWCMRGHQCTHDADNRCLGESKGGN